MSLAAEQHRLVFTLTVRHVEFNAADGSDEVTRQWTEVWETTLDGRLTTLSRNGGPGRSWLLPSHAPEPGDVVTVREPGELVIARTPRAPLPRDPEQLEAAQRAAGWRMAMQKGGEDPDEQA
ncbi:MAG: hypothetical protein JNJ54_16395 [Myxococcaceae bacterium]|nr:hypothetical protein [Myxococcaceae bacterium]